MARISGIQIEKDSKGRPTYAHINLKKHKELFPYLEQIGAIEESDFEKLSKKAITGEELLNRILPRVEKLFDK